MKLCLCGCGLPALLRKYHNSTHQERAQKRRSRDKKRTFSVVELSISASIEIEEPSRTAFGVPCTALVADLFADDQERFCAMQYVARREP